MSYCNFVLAEQNSISADLPVVMCSQGSKNNLQSGSGFVQVDSQLVSDLLAASDSAEDHGESGSHLIAEEFALWEQSEFSHVE